MVQGNIWDVGTTKLDDDDDVVNLKLTAGDAKPRKLGDISRIPQFLVLTYSCTCPARFLIELFLEAGQTRLLKPLAQF